MSTALDDGAEIVRACFKAYVDKDRAAIESLIIDDFCFTCGCGTFSDSPAFKPDGSWDGTTRRIGVNARLFDDFDAASAPVEVIDGKNLW